MPRGRYKRRTQVSTSLKVRVHSSFCMPSQTTWGIHDLKKLHNKDIHLELWAAIYGEILNHA